MNLKDYVKDNSGFAYVRRVNNKEDKFPIIISSTNNWVINLEHHWHLEEHEWQGYEVVSCHNVKISGERDKFPTTGKTRLSWKIEE